METCAYFWFDNEPWCGDIRVAGYENDKGHELGWCAGDQEPEDC